jgi:hypothetical protein
MKAIFGILGSIVSALACHSAEVIAVAHPGEGISPGKTVVWTPLFQAAWDDLHRELGAPIRIDPPNALMSRLDDFEWERESVMPEGHWRVWAGPATRELFENANPKRKEAEPGSILDPDLHALDDVRIPVLKLESNYDFRPQLDSTRSFGKAGDPWRIFMAKQLVKFQLTEKGAKIRVKVETGVEPFGGAPPSSRIEPRRFHYDRPFFVFLWRKGAGWPYFGVWIGDASAMERFEKQ